MQRIYTFGLSLLFLTNAQATSLRLLCTSLENPSRVLIHINSPSPQDDCDISYDEDCGKTVGDFTLTADLAHPQDMAVNDSEKDRYTDSFNEAEENGLEITQEDLFSLRLAPGFRGIILAGGRVPVEITSLMASEGSGHFQLFCNKQ